MDDVLAFRPAPTAVGRRVDAETFLQRLEAMTPERRAYALEALARNFADSSQPELLAQLLSLLPYLDAKVRALGPQPLIDDFDLYLRLDAGRGDRTLAQVREAIELAAHVLADDREQTSAQLVARLSSGGSEASRLLEDAERVARSDWLRPMTGSLPSAGGPLARTLTHDAAVNGIVITPDERRLVSCSDDGTVRVWDVETGVELQQLGGVTRGDAVESVAVHPDGVRILSVTRRALQIWSLESGLLDYELEAPTEGGFDHVAVSPDGRHAVTVSYGTMTVWDLVRRVAIRALEGHGYPGRVSMTAYSPDGRLLVSASWDDTLKIWDVEKGRELRTLKGHDDDVSVVAVTPNGLVVSGAMRELRVWDLRSGRQLESYVDEGIYPLTALTTTVDGATAVCGTNSGELVLWELATGNTTALEVHESRITGVVVTRSGEIAATGSMDGTLKLWRLDRALSDAGGPAHGEWVEDAATSFDGSLAATSSGDKTIRVWSLERAELVLTLQGHEGTVRGVAFLADGRIVSVGGEGDNRVPNTLCTWDARSGRKLTTWKPRGYGERLDAIAAEPDGRTAVTSYYIDDLQDHIYGVYVWDLERGEIVGSESEIGNPYYSQTLAWATRGRVLSAPVYEDPSIAVWLPEDFSVLARLRGPNRRITALAAAANAELGVFGDDEGIISVWNLESYRELGSFAGHRRGVSTIALTADGRRAVSGGMDRVVALWDLESVQRISAFTGESAIAAVAISPKGSQVVAGESSGRVHLLELRPPSGPAPL